MKIDFISLFTVVLVHICMLNLWKGAVTRCNGSCKLSRNHWRHLCRILPKKNKRSITSFEVVTTTEAYNNDIFCSTYALKSLVPVPGYFAQDVKCEWSTQKGKTSSGIFLTLILYSLFKERTITTWRNKFARFYLRLFHSFREVLAKNSYWSAETVMRS